jgi:cell division protein FtsN
MKRQARFDRSLAATALAVVLGGSLLMAAPVHAQHEHAHEQEAHATAGLTLDDGARWATDEPLRIGMQRIRDAAAPAIDAGPHSLSQEAARALAAAVREQVSYLVANCKLEPKADAVLHLLIAELLGGAEALDQDPHAEGGLPRIERALRQYPAYFEHAGF